MIYEAKMAFTGETVRIEATIPTGPAQRKNDKMDQVYPTSLIFLPGMIANDRKPMVAYAEDLWEDGDHVRALQATFPAITDEDIEDAEDNPARTLRMIRRAGWENLTDDPNVTTCYLVGEDGEEITNPRTIALREEQAKADRYFNLMDSGAIRPVMDHEDYA